MADSNFWQDRNVFVTGCTGILGSWLTMALMDRNANVVGLVRDWVPRSNLVLSGYFNRINVVRGCITDYVLLERIFNEYEIDTCFHLAAQTIVTIANRSALSTFDANIRGTWTLLEAARRCQTVTRLVVASSDKAYGSKESLPYVETDPLQGRHPYDVSKSCADLLTQAYYHTYRLPVGITRCGNIYGGGDLNFNRIVPGTVRSVLHDEDPIVRSDGTPAREYIFVLDIVDAYLTLAQALDDPRFHGEAFNFGNETPVKALELVNKIIALSGHSHLKPRILGTGKLAGEIEQQWLSSRKAYERLVWQPQYSLDDGLLETIAWYERFFQEVR